MIRIFSFVASCAGKKSRTLRYSDRLAEVLTRMAAEEGEEVVYESMTADELDIRFCRSCLSCFTHGVCPLDSQDQMPLLKKKMLECDILFFGTPVYLGEMSGVAKCVLDRISYWAHRFELTGKSAVVFATTSNSYGQSTADTLKKMLQFTGAAVVHAGYAVTANGHPNLYLEKELMPELEMISRKILDSRDDPEQFIIPEQERDFLAFKLMYRKRRKFADLTGLEVWDEVKVGEQRKFESFSSFAEMAAYVRTHDGWEENNAQGEL